MRNIINVIDKDIPKITIASLEIGQMFRYPTKSNEQNVYMKVALNEATGVVLLSTGVVYSNFNTFSTIEVVDAISITR